MTYDRRSMLDLGSLPDRRQGDRRTFVRPQPDRREGGVARAGVFAAVLVFATGLPRPVLLPELAWSPWSPSSVPTPRNGVPIELNDAVRATIHLYRNGMRDWFSGALSRGGRYLPAIREAFVAEGLPPELAYVALVESEFRAEAVSGAKAKGFWQFMPATGRRFGLAQDSWVDERSDTDKASRAAAQYLRHLHDVFEDWNLALAAYNAGEGTVRRAIQRHGTNDFWELSRARALPRETRDYVPRIQAAILVAGAPERYGFEIDPKSPSSEAVETVEVDGPFALRDVARCTGLDLATLRALNPVLVKPATPAHRTFDLKVPEGSGDAVAACLESVPQVKTHVIRGRGVTLAVVARKYGTRVSDLARVNGLATRSKLQLARGTELIIPAKTVLTD
jgi:membrane-bound lytic murein transglycosylase D